MKRHILRMILAAALLLPTMGLMAQEELTVANGTYSCSHAPWYPYWTDINYHTEWVYPAEMLGEMAGSNITSLTFYCNNTSVAYASLGNGTTRVMMKEVTASAPGTTWLSDDGTQVYQGTISIVNGVHSIEFDEPFLYEGGNLAIAYIFTAGGTCGTTSEWFVGVSTSSQSGAYGSNASSGTPGNPTSYLPKTTFGYVPAGDDYCRTPGSPTLSDISETEATLSWTPRNGESSWVVYLGGEEVTSVSDTFYTFTGMSASTQYTVGVRALCAAGDTSSTASKSFRTPCGFIASFPYTENFDSYAYQGAIDPCWSIINQYTSSSYPYSTTTYYHGSTGKSLYFYAGSGTYQYASLPPVEDLNGMMLTFWTYIGSPSSAQMQVGLMTDPDDASTFTAIYTTPTTMTASTWMEHEVLVPAGTTAQYLAFHNTGSSYYTVYLDDVTLMVAPECMHPASVAVSGVGENTATVTVNDPSETGNYFYYVLRGTTVVDSGAFSDTTLQLTGLSSSSSYTVQVLSICSDGNRTAPVSADFNTSCALLTDDDLPLYEDFESYGTAVNEFNCWTRTVFGNSYQGYPQTSSATGPNGEGSRVLYFYSNSSYHYLALPPVENVSTKMLSFYLRQVTTGVGVTVGVMTNPADSSTFTALGSYVPTSSSEWDNIEVPLSGYEGEGQYVAFRMMWPNYGGCYIDNVTLMTAPSCMRPVSVSVSDIGETEATINVNDPNEAGAYTYYLLQGSTVVDSGDFSELTHQLTDLTSSSTYTVRVMTNCEDGSRTSYVSASFSTACGNISTLPWTEGFEGTYTSIGYQAQINCWDFVQHNGTGYTDIATTSHSGGHSMRYVPQTNQQMTVVLPPFDDISGLEMTLWCRAESATSSGSLVMGYMADTAFVAMKSVSGNTYSGTWVLEDVTFAGAPAGARIAIRQMSNTTNYYWWIDDIDVHTAPSCTRPVVSVNGLTDTSATLSINDANEMNNYKIFIAGQDTIETTDNTYTIGGLTAATAYTVRVYTVCDDGTMTNATDVSFTTECGSEAFPWSCTQDSLYLIGNANWTQCWSYTSNVYRSTSNGILYVYTNAANTEFRLPAVDIPDYDQAQVRISVACTTANTQFRVGLMEGSTAMWIDTITAIVTTSVTDAAEYVIPLVGYTGTGRRVVVGGIDNKSVFYQAFYVEPLDQCPPVSNLNVTDIDDANATLTWTSNGEESSWLVYLNGSFDGTATSTTYSLSDLTGSTSYNVVVRALCGDGDTSSERTVSFRTPCVMLTHADLPIEENFDSYVSASGSAIDPCWTRIDLYSTNQNTYPYPYSSTHHGSTGNSLYFYPGYSYQPELAVLPPIDSLGDLYINLWVYRASTNVRMDVGVMTDPSDASTFELIESLEPTTSTWTEYNVSFADYTGTGHYIALRGYVSSSYGYSIYVDDITVQSLTTCANSITATVNSVTGDGATLGYNIGFGLSESVTLTVKDAAGNVVQTVTDAESPVTVTGLDAQTSYTVEVTLYCNGEVVATDSRNFMTRCEGGTEMEISSATTGYSAINNQRFPIHSWFTNSYTNMVYTAAELGGEAMTISSLSINHNYSNDFTGYSGSIYIGHATDSVLTSTMYTPDQLELVYTGSFDMVNGWNEFLFDVPFAYNGTDNIVVAFKASRPSGNSGNVERFVGHTAWQGASSYWCDDSSPYSGSGSGNLQNFRPDIKLGNCGGGETPGPGPQPETCNAPTNLHSTAATQTSVTLDWTAGGSESQWQLQVDGGQPVSVSAHPHTLNGLTAGTTYSVKVRAVCGEGNYSDWSASVDVSTDTADTPGPGPNGIEDAAAAVFGLYPNPASTTVRIQVDGEARVAVIDQSGRTVAAVNANGSTDIDVSQLAKGAYYVRVSTADATAVRKLIVR